MFNLVLTIVALLVCSWAARANYNAGDYPWMLLSIIFAVWNGFNLIVLLR